MDRRHGPGTRGARDPYFDNAKYLTIVLVACGHAWEPLTYGSRTVTAVYLGVYAFHMPAFALISGYFSRSFDMAPGRLRRLVGGVVVPYVLFEIAYTLFYRWAQDDPGYPISLLDPWYLMWFLVALFIWRLTTPLWLQLRHPMPVALAIAALVSMTPDAGGDLGLQRVVGFLPFFVLGLTLRPEHFERLRTRRARLWALPVAAGALAAAYVVAPWFDAGWFYRRGSVTGLGAPAWAGLVTTAGPVRPRRRPQRLLPGLGAGADDTVHDAGHGDAVRVPAARLPHQVVALLGLVRPPVAAHPGG